MKNTTTDLEKLKAEVIEMLSYSIELFKRKDVEGLVGRFTIDGTLKIPEAPLISGIEAIRGNYQSMMQLEHFDINLKIIKADIAEAGDLAYALADFTVSFQTPCGPFNDSGVTLQVFKRENNAWKIAAENLSFGPK
jgi:ketosteroid isomerase-like protein